MYSALCQLWLYFKCFVNKVELSWSFWEEQLCWVTSPPPTPQLRQSCQRINHWRVKHRLHQWILAGETKLFFLFLLIILHRLKINVERPPAGRGRMVLTSGTFCRHMRSMKTTPRMTPRPIRMKGALVSTFCSVTMEWSFEAEASSMRTLWRKQPIKTEH